MRTMLMVALALLVAAQADAAVRPFPASGPSWNNSQKLDWGKLKGKVVLLDFFNRH
jgi:hypothetical protein